MDRPFLLCPCTINESLLLFLTFDFEFLSWNIFWNISSILSIVTALVLVDVMILREPFYRWLIPIRMDTDRRVPFYWWFPALFYVKCYQPWRCWNLLLWMLVDYWGNLLLFWSWIGKSLHMFYWYLFFCASFWVFCWKVRVHVYCCSRVKEVDCHWSLY